MASEQSPLINRGRSVALSSGIGLGCGALLSALLLMGLSASCSAGEVSPEPEAEVQAAQAFRTGRFEDALTAWTTVYRDYVKQGDLGGQVRTLLDLSEVYLALGRTREALASSQRASQQVKGGEDSGLRAAVLTGLGNVYGRKGDRQAGERYLRAGIEMAGRVRAPEVAAPAYNNLGNLLAISGEADAALDAYGHGERYARDIGDTSLGISAMINRARLLYETWRGDEGRAILYSLLEPVAKEAPSHDKAYHYLAIGQMLLDDATAEGTQLSTNRRLAYRALENGRATAVAMRDRKAESYALGYLARVYERSDLLEDALQLTRKARFIAQQARAPALSYRWNWQVGRLLKMLGETDSAIRAYRQAVADVQALRSTLTVADTLSDLPLQNVIHPLYFEFAGLMLDKAASLEPEAPQAQAYMREARDTVELLKAAELEDYFQDDCVARLRSKVTDIDSLATDTAVLYPIILPDHLVLLLTLPTGMKQVRVAVDADTLTQDLHTFRQLLEKPSTRQYLPYARKFYDWLIRPLEGDLTDRSIDTLVVIPGGPLRGIPFSALHDGHDFLVQRYAVVVTPGLTLTAPTPLKTANARVLLAGLSQPSQGFSALPFVAEEMNDVAGIFDADLLEDQRFILNNLEDALRRTPYSVVHVASHGQFSHSLQDTFLLTYDGKLSLPKLESLVRPTGFREQPIELLTLSACQTAAGDDRAALGLAGVSIKAGARSALATLWFINDRASALLVKAFYEALKDSSISKAKALQQAQRQLLKDPLYRHPAYWAPFLLIGNWL